MEGRDGVMIVNGKVQVFTKEVKVMTLTGRQDGAAATEAAKAPDAEPTPAANSGDGKAAVGGDSGKTADNGANQGKDNASPKAAEPTPAKSNSNTPAGEDADQGKGDQPAQAAQPTPSNENSKQDGEKQGGNQASPKANTPTPATEPTPSQEVRRFYLHYVMF
jgi:hypothetical protein